METLTRKELERLKKIELLRKLLQLIFFKHIKLLSIIFVSLIVAIFVGVYFVVTLSPVRYIARISLYYNPKNTRNISHFDTKYVLQMLNRQTVRHRFYEETSEDGSRIPCTISIRPEKRDKNHYQLSLNSGTAHNAVAFVNTFADLCVKAYIEERTESLQNWKKVLQQKKQDVFKDIQQVNLDKTRIGAPLHAPSPEKDFEQLRVIMDDQQSAHTKLGLAIGNLEHRQKRLKAAIAKINPALFDHEKKIRESLENQKALEKEIALNRQLYTEENPKLIALTSRKKSSDAAFAAFLKERNLSVKDLDDLTNADALKNELKAVSDELETRIGEMRVLESEIANTNNRFHKLNEILPHVQQLNQQHASLMESLQTIDASIADINYLLPLVKDDLKIGIRATKAIGQKPFSRKNLAIGFFAALMLTAFAATSLLIFEFLFGKVTDESELELFYEFRHLGALPARESLTEAETRVVFNTV